MVGHNCGNKANPSEPVRVTQTWVPKKVNEVKESINQEASILDMYVTVVLDEVTQVEEVVAITTNNFQSGVHLRVKVVYLIL